MRGAPPEPVISAVIRAGFEFVSMVATRASVDLSKRQAAELGELFRTFLHGALCKAVAGRVPSPDPAELRRKIVADARRILRLLAAEFGGRNQGKRRRS
jgi:hypothetical protein